MDKDRFRRILPKSFEHALEIEKKKPGTQECTTQTKPEDVR